jgi:hypothetical protein
MDLKESTFIAVCKLTIKVVMPTIQLLFREILKVCLEIV